MNEMKKKRNMSCASAAEDFNCIVLQIRKSDLLKDVLYLSSSSSVPLSKYYDNISGHAKAARMQTGKQYPQLAAHFSLTINQCRELCHSNGNPKTNTHTNSTSRFLGNEIQFVKSIHTTMNYERLQCTNRTIFNWIKY